MSLKRAGLAAWVAEVLNGTAFDELFSRLYSTCSVAFIFLRSSALLQLNFFFLTGSCVAAKTFAYHASPETCFYELVCLQSKTVKKGKQICVPFADLHVKCSTVH